ncbi:MAG: tRNA (guanosine(46)-N7)-methyltransferase TrmB, partial [Clostridiales bacterium]|nr:tRNA (guanosine(46)-N7)-methyltransferase TrmB [Clostridiales bacterium]
MRTRKKPWTGRELHENSSVVNEPMRLRGKWKEYFGSNNPIHLEIGCGKGKFLTAAAQAFPEINYIGLER